MSVGGSGDPAHLGPGAPDGERWWTEVVDGHLDRVYAFVLRRVPHPADAEDITAEVFLRAWRWLDARRTPGEVTAWLFRAARTAIAEHWRQAARERDLLARVRERDVPAAAGAAPQRALALLERLPSRYRLVLQWRFLDGLEVAEVARRLGLSAAAVRVLQYRALRAAARLAEGGQDGGPA